MKTSIRITEHYNTGPFEFFEIAAEVEGDVEDPEDLKDLNERLDDALYQGRKRILSISSNHDSAIHEHPAIT